MLLARGLPQLALLFLVDSILALFVFLWVQFIYVFPLGYRKRSVEDNLYSENAIGFSSESPKVKDQSDSLFEK